MRGEKSSVRQSYSGKKGSPPRARGKVTEEIIVCAGVGITPACAGKSQGWLRGWGYTQDHPRVRGEKIPLFGWADDGWGSPPRARGKVDQLGGHIIPAGITPACAGKRVGEIIVLAA